MEGIFINVASSCLFIDEVQNHDTVEECIQRKYPEIWKAVQGESYLLCGRRLVNSRDIIQPGHVYHVVPRVLGGKGGFGSMLRAIGAQIEKTTNREACRDLSGRRMRDMNNEKRLREWVSKASDREKEKEQSKQERRERRLAAQNSHKFEDPEYHSQKQKVFDNLEESLQIGLQKASGSHAASTLGTSSSGLGKRKAPAAAAGSAKKSLNWIGVDMENASDMSSDESGEEAEAPAGGVTSSSRGVTSSSENSMESSTSSSHQGQSSNQLDAASIEILFPQFVKPDTEMANTDVTEPTCGTSNESRESDSNHSNQASTERKEADKGHQHGLLKALATTPPKHGIPKEPQQMVEVDLMTYGNAKDLEAIGLDNLKAALQNRGLKCGGTLEQRAERLWAVRELKAEQYPANLMAKPAKGKK